MRVFRITKKEYKYFENMDPWNYLERLELPSYFALGVMEESKNKKEEIPAGYVICKIHEEGLMIEWLYVNKAFRMQGIGEALLICLYELAEKNGYRKLYACFHMEDGRSEFYPQEEQYFAERLFEPYPSCAKDILMNLQTLETLPFFQQKAEIKHKMYPLSVIDLDKLKCDIKELATRQDAMKLYDIEGKGHLFDENISVLMYENDRVCGAALYQTVRSTGNSSGKNERVVIYPVYIYSELIEDEKNLLYCTLLLANKKYKKDTDVRILIRSEKGIQLLETIVHAQSEKSRMMIADVATYTKQVNEQKRYQELLSYIEQEDIATIR